MNPQIAGTKKPTGKVGFFNCIRNACVRSSYMHQSIQGNTAYPAPQNANHDFVARSHFELAVNAARQVRVQYSRQSKRQLVRECLQHLHAFLAAPRPGAAHE